MKKKLLAILTALCLVAVMLPAAMAANYSDTKGHWAEDAINVWSGYGVVEGSNGTYEPDRAMLRCEMAAVLTRLLKLPAAPSAGFTDVPDGEWYADYMNRCAAAGIITGSEGKAFPLQPLTRQEAMTMLARALSIAAGNDAFLAAFPDQGDVAAWAKGYFAAMVEAGIIDGMSGKLEPAYPMDRAMVVTVLNRAVGVYACEEGKTYQANGAGIVLVAAQNVTVTGAAQNVIVVADTGKVNLTNMNVVGKVVVQADNVTLNVAGTSSVKEVYVENTAANAQVVVGSGATVGTTNQPTQPAQPVTPPVVIPPVVHTHNYVPVVTAPTCTADGYTTYTCACGDVVIGNTVAALGHTEEVIPAVAPTCTTNGLKAGKKCSVCGTVTVPQEDDNATGHNFGTCGHTAAEAMKAEAKVSSGTAVVTATVYDDYSAVAVFPGSATVDSNTVTVGVKLQNVGSLGVDGVREHSMTLTPNLGPNSISLAGSFASICKFEDATVNVNVAGTAFDYIVTGLGDRTQGDTPNFDNTITAKASDIEAARAAFAALADKVTTETVAGGDSKAVVAYGSYLKVGDKQVNVTAPLTIDDLNNPGVSFEQQIRDALTLADAEGTSVEAFLAAGSSITIDSSKATLTANVKIVITGVNVDGSILTELQAAQGKTAIVKKAVELVDDLIGAIDAANTPVGVTVTFSVG